MFPTVNKKFPKGNTIVSQNLKQALDEEGVKPAHLAAAAGISRSYISKLLSGAKVNLSIETAEKIAKAVQRDVDWLLGRETSAKRDVSQVTNAISADGASQQLDVSSRDRIPYMVPILSYAQGGQAIDFELLAAEDRESVPSLCRDPKAFALILRGDSMEPFYHEGDVIIVSPSEDLRYERLAVAQLTGVGVCFKLLNMPPARGMVRLSSYNPAFAPTDRPERDFDWIWPVHSVIKYERQ